MSEINRVVDKFKDIKFCDLESEDQKEYLGALAERGASEVLKKLGLDDENAASDIKSIRDLLRGFRVVRSTALTTILVNFGKVVGWVIILILAGWFIRSTPAINNLVIETIKP